MSFKGFKFVPPYVEVVSEGSPVHTRVYNVNKKGQRTEIHGVRKAEFHVEAGKVPVLLLTVICPKVTAKVKKATRK